MKIEQYQAETERLTRESTVLLADVRTRLEKGEVLSLLEQRGVLLSIQLLVENAIGKAKRKLKAMNQTVPVSGYDVFEVLRQNEELSSPDLNSWKRIIGLRNAIVHEYQDIDWARVELLIKENRIQFVIDFLLRTF